MACHIQMGMTGHIWLMFTDIQYLQQSPKVNGFHEADT